MKFALEKKKKRLQIELEMFSVTRQQELYICKHYNVSHCKLNYHVILSVALAEYFLLQPLFARYGNKMFAGSELGCRAILTVFEVEMNDNEMQRLKFIICLDDHVAFLWDE